MKLEDFQDYNNPKYIESCNKIIEYGNCKNIQFCTECPFHWYNLTKEFADCTEYGNSTDCLLKDEKLVESAKEFKELVQMNKGMTHEQYMKKIENVDFSSELVSIEDINSILNKDEEYIILDNEYEIIHRIKTLKEAEELIEDSILTQFSNKEYIIAKVIKKAKLEKKVVWEE